MTHADEDDELELGGPVGDDEIGDVDDGIEIDADGDGVEDVVAAAADADDDDDEGDGEEGESTPRRKRETVEAIAVEDVANIEARRHVREQLESDVEAFLRRGGKITQVADEVRADPPKKPESKYGTRSI